MKGFAKGMIIGGIVGASISMAMNSDMMHGERKRRIMKAGRHFMRRTGEFISDTIGMFR